MKKANLDWKPLCMCELKDGKQYLVVLKKTTGKGGFYDIYSAYWSQDEKMFYEMMNSEKTRFLGESIIPREEMYVCENWNLPNV